MIDRMKQYRAWAVPALLVALAVHFQGIAASDHAMADSAVLGEPNSELASSTPKTTAPSQLPPTAPSASASSADVRDIPSISGRYAIGGRTLLPYIGAGFAGGYNSEFNRSLSGAPPSQSEFGLRSEFGQSVSPNEFQLGIRIPF
jgi:hypothetical protein